MGTRESVKELLAAIKCWGDETEQALKTFMETVEGLSDLLCCVEDGEEGAE